LEVVAGALSASGAGNSTPVTLMACPAARTSSPSPRRLRAGEPPSRRALGRRRSASALHLRLARRAAGRQPAEIGLQRSGDRIGQRRELRSRSPVPASVRATWTRTARLSASLRRTRMPAGRSSSSLLCASARTSGVSVCVGDRPPTARPESRWAARRSRRS
jgi:hypothetical protein